MDEYTLTLHEVREFYKDEWDYHFDAPNPYPYVKSRGAEFDRLIARVRAEAWDEGFEAGEQHGRMPSMYPDISNPYRTEEA